MNIEEFEGYCQFDCTDETSTMTMIAEASEGDRMFCGKMATRPNPAEEDNPALKFCNRHHAFLQGYLAGWYDGNGRPEHFVDVERLLRAYINTRRCYECGTEEVARSTFITNKADPTVAYRLVCGHSTID